MPPNGTDLHDAMVIAHSGRPPHQHLRGPVGQLSWDAGTLCRSWVVYLEAAPRSGPDERMIVGLIGELEQAGGGGFQRADQVRVAALRAAGVRLSPAERVLEDLAVFGVVRAETGPAHGAGSTVVAKVPDSASTSCDASTGACEGHAPGNSSWGRETTGNGVDGPAQDVGGIGAQVE